jgi:outer membrane protein OmpA-like peptidoglycan-associated protein
MKIHQLLHLLIVIVLFGSCYSYGPIHKPYGYNKKTKEYKQYYINKTFEDAKVSIPEAEVKLIEDSIKILFPENILYKLQEVQPSSTYKPSFEKLTALLLNHTETDLLITGHCDNTGSVSFNKKLSGKRADFIKHYLMQLGVTSGRMESWGLGSSSPIADNSSIEGQAKNRRVEFVVLYMTN